MDVVGALGTGRSSGPRPPPRSNRHLSRPDRRHGLREAPPIATRGLHAVALAAMLGLAGLDRSCRCSGLPGPGPGRPITHNGRRCTRPRSRVGLMFATALRRRMIPLDGAPPPAPSPARSPRSSSSFKIWTTEPGRRELVDHRRDARLPVRLPERERRILRRWSQIASLPIAARPADRRRPSGRGSRASPPPASRLATVSQSRGSLLALRSRPDRRSSSPRRTAVAPPVASVAALVPVAIVVLRAPRRVRRGGQHPRRWTTCKRAATAR